MRLFSKQQMCGWISASIAAVGFCGMARAEYPEKPIRIIVPFLPGGATDVLARTVGQHLSQRWGQQVLVENRPGAGGNIGAEAGAKSAPDGYTLTLTAAGIVAVNPHIYSKLGYDSIKDFVPITQLVDAPMLMAVNPAIPVRNLKEYISLAKSKPGTLSIANGGTGTAQHLAAVSFDRAAGISSLHVPYKGSPQATADVVGGQAAAIIDNLVTLLPQVQSAKLRPLAVTSRNRLPSMPDVPTMSEAGVPNFEAGTWYGLVAPAGTPQEIVNKLQREVVDIIRTPAVEENIAKLGLRVVGSTSAEFGRFQQNERKKAGDIVKAADIKAE